MTIRTRRTDEPTAGRTHRSLRRAAGVLLATCAIAGCGDDDGGDDPRAVPGPEVSVFTSGDFDDVPVFRGATPLQEPTVEDGTVTGSYETLTGAPRTVLDFYADELPALGWQVIQQPIETSPMVWRGEWVRDGRRLEVSAQDISDEPEDLRTQLNLVLFDDAGGDPVATVPAAP